MATILTISQAADILQVNENTLSTLTNIGQIPHLRLSAASGGEFRFNTVDLDGWLRQGITPAINDQVYIKRFARRIEKLYPEALAKLREYDKQFIGPRKPKGYNLTKVFNKKLGFVYYVRYIENGKLVPTRWSTHTNNPDAAVQFALKNRDKLLSEYHQKKAGQNPSGSLYAIMKRYMKIQ